MGITDRVVAEKCGLDIFKHIIDDKTIICNKRPYYTIADELVPSGVMRWLAGETTLSDCHLIDEL